MMYLVQGLNSFHLERLHKPENSGFSVVAWYYVLIGIKSYEGPHCPLLLKERNNLKVKNALIRRTNLVRERQQKIAVNNERSGAGTPIPRDLVKVGILITLVEIRELWVCSRATFNRIFCCFKT